MFFEPSNEAAFYFFNWKLNVKYILWKQEIEGAKLKAFWLNVCSWGGRAILNSIELDLILGIRFVREELKISHSINMKIKTASIDTALPKEERAFQAKKGSG